MLFYLIQFTLVVLCWYYQTPFFVNIFSSTTNKFIHSHSSYILYTHFHGNDFLGYFSPFWLPSVKHEFVWLSFRGVSGQLLGCFLMPTFFLGYFSLFWWTNVKHEFVCGAFRATRRIVSRILRQLGSVMSAHTELLTVCAIHAKHNNMCDCVWFIVCN